MKAITTDALKAIDVATHTDKAACDAAHHVRHQLEAIVHDLSPRNVMLTAMSQHPDLPLSAALAKLLESVVDTAKALAALKAQANELRSAEELCLKPMTDAATQRIAAIGDAIAQAARDISSTTNREHDHAAKVKVLKGAGVSSEEIERIKPNEDYAGQRAKLRAAIDDMCLERVGLHMFARTLDADVLTKPLTIPETVGADL